MKRILLSAALVAVLLAALVGALPVGAQSGNTWRIDYFNNTNWAGSPVTTQWNSLIAFNWGFGSPSPAVPVDNFTGRMTTDAFFYAGTYQFSAVADDEVALIIDGVTRLDTRGQGQSGKSFTLNIPMWQGNAPRRSALPRVHADGVRLRELDAAGERWRHPGATGGNVPAAAALGQLGADAVRQLHALPPTEHPPGQLLRLGRRLGFAEPGLHPDGTADRQLERLRGECDQHVHKRQPGSAGVRLLPHPGRLVPALNAPAGPDAREKTGLPY